MWVKTQVLVLTNDFGTLLSGISLMLRPMYIYIYIYIYMYIYMYVYVYIYTYNGPKAITPVVHTKVASKWMFPKKETVVLGIDP